MMTRFESKLNRVINLNNQVNEITKVLSAIVESHLGDNWFLTYDIGDGWLIVSPDSNQYLVDDYLATQRMTRAAAIRYIEARKFN